MYFKTLVISLSLLSSMAVSPAKAEPINVRTAQMASLGIQTAVINPAQTTRAAAYPAQVRVPNAQMRLVSAPFAGMISVLAVAPGERVRRDQVVAELASPSALELQREALQASNQTALLQKALKRDEQLFAEGLIPESRFQATQAASAQANALSNERRQSLALAGITPGKTGGTVALRSPIDGVVMEQGVQLGQRVEPSAMIVSLAKLSPLWLEIQAPLPVAASLREGTTVKLVDSDINGKLIAIGRAVDAGSQTVLLRAEVVAGAQRLTPGQVVEVEIADNSQIGVQLPATALVRHEGKTYVFVQTAGDDKGATFESRPVRIVSQGGDSVTADSVKAGEKVAIKGVSGLKAMLAGVGKE
jgi:RND family efflux transporter MFP subunit